MNLADKSISGFSPSPSARKNNMSIGKQRTLENFSMSNNSPDKKVPKRDSSDFRIKPSNEVHLNKQQFESLKREIIHELMSELPQPTIERSSVLVDALSTDQSQFVNNQSSFTDSLSAKILFLVNNKEMIKNANMNLKSQNQDSRIKIKKSNGGGTMNRFKKE
mmetsp:Transcript_20575/g.20306  ORF Transcript_20575/g.20306 Transcript_20575/m.20306 type:complete len:163 (-) Transcript_20575:28-516(-)